MDNSLDCDYTISVKTEDEKADRLNEETSRVADATCLELSGSPVGRVFTIFDHMSRDSSGARLCVIAVPSCQKAHKLLPRVLIANAELLSRPYVPVINKINNRKLWPT